jgi:hypothetical protein
MEQMLCAWALAEPDYLSVYHERRTESIFEKTMGKTMSFVFLVYDFFSPKPINLRSPSSSADI